ncbi:Fpg/Nei family DNA glycosylase [Salinibacterium soli]|uniref:DNA-formamidopyrimidine glycosylase family protein n=1 Tax=Antiquaquibacter soli TaxID=3064523 RepID=A0ABT9BKP3_9MICO|nr:DNA-formamidopyrimidine glycosylase family protein [Protaetiibacter sp. WY-16]MDO7881597.1 DNA-formamidopyrimidine glycosylase family protein [Protaetiibacter sp. WY-16]
MPELPEVHALVTDLRARLIGRTVKRLEIVAFSALKTFDPPVSALEGQVVRGVDRHGKYLDLEIGDLHVLIHLARAGWLRWRESAPQSSGRPNRGPLAARLVLADDDSAVSTGSGFDLTEAGTKKSLAIHVVRSPMDVDRVRTLGPDPLSPRFTVEAFRAILAAAGRSQIKGVLRNQALIAGIGNAYSDEILHVARMSPFKPADMAEEESARLYDAIHETLQAAIDRADGLAASELKAEKKTNLRVHGRTGEACPVCGDTIRQVTYSDSSLQYCPTCQTGGKPLADRVLSRLLK